MHFTFWMCSVRVNAALDSSIVVENTCFETKTEIRPRPQNFLETKTGCLSRPLVRDRDQK